METYLTKLYAKQISLTEWFEAIGDPRAAELRQEDAHKHDRLNILNQAIGLPFGKPVRFDAADVANRSPNLLAYIKNHGQEECALRLIPRKPELPKLRMRGYTVERALQWFDEQQINPADYQADFVPHDHAIWATIFTVTNKGIYGEIKKGEPNQLTQGIYHQGDQTPTTFGYDFKSWQLSEDTPGAPELLKDIVLHLHVPSKAKQAGLASKLGATFAHGYLQGYFETSTSNEYGTWFIDYNRQLGNIYTHTPGAKSNADALLHGRSGSPGTATGNVRIVLPDHIRTAKIKGSDILVCAMTTPDYLPLMQQAAAIVTDMGGVLSHASIIARELKKPCVTGTKDATKKLLPGQRVTVDGTKGVVLPA